MSVNSTRRERKRLAGISIMRLPRRAAAGLDGCNVDTLSSCRKRWMHRERNVILPWECAGGHAALHRRQQAVEHDPRLQPNPSPCHANRVFKETRITRIDGREV